MQNEIAYGTNLPLEGSDVGYLLGMLWVFGFMALVLVAFVGKRTNERKNRTMGFELEVIKTKHHHSDNANKSLARYMSGQGLETYFAGYSHKTTPHTKVVTDTSLSSGGIEIVSPPLTKKQRRPWLQTVTSALAGLVKVDRSCGVHFHEGLRPANKMFDEEGVMRWTEAQHVGAKVTHIYGLFQHALNTVIPSSRHDNGYCHSLANSPQRLLAQGPCGAADQYEFWQSEYNYYSRTRYNAVNITSLRKYGTIEFRQHAGSINAVKLDAWAQLCGLIVQRAISVTWEDLQMTANQWSKDGRDWNMEDLGHFLGLSPKTQLIQYFMGRADRLADRTHGIEPSLDHEPNSWDDVHTQDEEFEVRGYYIENVIDQVTTLISAEYHDTRVTEIDFRCWSCEEYHTMVNFVTYWDQSGRIARQHDWEAECTECGDRERVEIVDYSMSTYMLGFIGLAMSAGPIIAGLVLLIGCGIGAIHGAGAKRYKNRNALKALFVGLASRGKQASGFGWVRRSKPRTFMYLKAPVSSVEMQSEIRRQLNGQDDTQMMMLHTRFATHGVNNADNAHPHFSSDANVMLVHNGVVGNSDEVWRAIEREPTGPVDSQAIAEALAVGGIEKVVEHCVGTMSLIWSDMRDPQGTLKFWTNGGNPLVFGRLDRRHVGPVMVASTIDHLEQGAGKRLKTDHECVIGREYTIHPEGNITHRDIPGSEDSCGYGARYDWRTYGRGHKQVRKVTGTADNCTLPVQPATPTRPHLGADFVDLDLRFEHFSDNGGWEPFTGEHGAKLHGYCAFMHQGITPDGVRYDLPQFLQPWTDDDDGIAVLDGEWAVAGGLNQLWDNPGIHWYDQ